MKDLPYYPWYPADAKADENYSAMTDQELGFYHRCLDHSWINFGIPADINDLARAMHASPSYVERLWKRVGKCFEPLLDHPERLINPRQEFEREKTMRTSESASKSARARWNKRNANALPSQCEVDTRAYDSVFDSVSGSKIKKTSLQSETFGKFVEACAAAEMQGSEVDLERARVVWVQLSVNEQVAACQGIKDRVACGEYREAKFRPLPQTYLSEKKWQRNLRPSSEPSEDRAIAHRNQVVKFAKLFKELGS